MMETDTDDLYGRIMAPNKRIQKVRSRFRRSQVDISQSDPETWQVVRSI